MKRYYKRMICEKCDRVYHRMSVPEMQAGSVKRAAELGAGAIDFEITFEDRLGRHCYLKGHSHDVKGMFNFYEWVGENNKKCELRDAMDAFERLVADAKDQHNH